MKYEIVHTNTFYYDNYVDQSMNTIRLKPRTDECQRLLSYQNQITPASMTKDHVDIWGNNVETFFIPQKHNFLEVKTTSIVSIQRAPFIRRIDYSPEMKSIFHSQLFHDHYLHFLHDTFYTYLEKDQIEEAVTNIGDIEDPVQFSLELMRYLHEVFTYDTLSTNVNTNATVAFSLKKGVCQDYTHVMLSILRARGIPARYVSGYLYVGENSALVGDSATHAWVEVMAPGIGWIGLDPTNNVEALENHIRIGTGRDYSDVSPLQGVYRGGKQRLDVKVSVTMLMHN
ncbi:transglutaminase family protein [Mesobacillus foraminis]|uniref:transglutaminase family protein n=1 Tax=Mesobacillus foraminis TaxID=279826 RepID=UPI001BE7A96D|nr:transglutaminase family protein [Mesobacillus foraminis]MBT2755525.1 transglutaminase family protein [Mesobacillus foraminis]